MTITKLELCVGEGVNLAPGSDWQQFAEKNILGSTASIHKYHYAILGTVAGQMAVKETGITDTAIACAIAQRFTEDAAPDLERKHMDEEARLLNEGINIGVRIGVIALEGEATI